MGDPQRHPVLEPRPRYRLRLAGPDSGKGAELESGSLVAVVSKWGSKRFGGRLVVLQMAIRGIVV